MEHPKRFYMEIECLLDVRLSILGSIDSEATKKVVEDDTYFNLDHHRYWELDPAFDRKTVEDRWLKRNAGDLRESLATNVFSIMRAKILNHTRPAVRPFTEAVEVTIDLGAMVLTRLEVVALKAQFEEAFKCPIKLTNSLIAKQSLVNLLQYDVIVIHDFDNFMNENAEALGNRPIIGKEIYAPLVLQEGAPEGIRIEIFTQVVREALIGVIAPDLKPLKEFRAFNMR